MLNLFKSSRQVLNSIKFKYKIIPSFHFSVTKKFFSEKDDAFWAEYEKRKLQNGKIPALPSQNIVINKVETKWRYANQHSLKTVEFKRALDELKKNEECPFLIIDLREEIEFEIYKFPKTTKVRIIYKKEWCNYSNFIQINERNKS